MIAHFGVDAVWIFDASAVGAVEALVDVGAALFVGAGVFDADALDGGARETRRADVAPETGVNVEAGDARVARSRSFALDRINSIK